MKDLPELGVDAAARAAGADPEVLRLENLDTDVPPPAAVLEVTRASVGVDAANSYLPFNGLAELRAAVAERLLGQAVEGRVGVGRVDAHAGARDLEHRGRRRHVVSRFSRRRTSGSAPAAGRPRPRRARGGPSSGAGGVWADGHEVRRSMGR